LRVLLARAKPPAVSSSSFVARSSKRQRQTGLDTQGFAVVRQTLKQLKDTVLKDIIVGWVASLVTKVQDNVVIIEFADVVSEWLLLPLEDAEDQRRLLSMQLTGAWMSEAIEMDVNLVAGIAGRCGRYPSGARGTPSWFGIIADTNMPSEGSDWHKFMDIDQAEDWDIYIQPGGLKSMLRTFRG